MCRIGHHQNQPATTQAFQAANQSVLLRYNPVLLIVDRKNLQFAESLSHGFQQTTEIATPGRTDDLLNDSRNVSRAGRKGKERCEACRNAKQGVCVIPGLGH